MATEGRRGAEPHLEPTRTTSRDDGGERATTEPSHEGATVFAAGTRIDRYELLERLGEGGMGVVYVARDPELDRRVALKVLRPELLGDEEVSVERNRLVREAHAMARVSHPNVVGIFDAGVFEQNVFLAVELVEGVDLSRWLEQERSWREVLDVFLAAGRGLAAAHAAGLVHRDFKPENVLVGKSGAIKVADFGLARSAALPETPEEKPKEPAPPSASPRPAISQSSSGQHILSSSITQVGMVTGTPRYMAPEQFSEGVGDALTDQFSFSVALYEALYGELPFGEKRNPFHAEPVSEAPKGSKVPQWVRRVVLRGLAHRPADRYPTLEAMLTALADDPAVRRRRLLTILGMGTLVLAAIGGTAAVALRLRAASDPCHDPAAKLAGTWDRQLRQQVEAAFRSTGAENAATLSAYALKALDRGGAEWIAAYQSACRDTRDRRLQSEAALRLRLDCLDDQRVDLRAAVEQMLHPEANNLAASIGAVAALPLTIECADARALSVGERPDPERRQDYEALRLELARGRAAIGAARYPEAKQIFAGAAQRAQALGSDALEAEALVGLASEALSPTSGEAAEAASQQAFRRAEVAHRDQLAATAAARIVIAQSLLGRPRATIDTSIERAQDALLRAGTGGIGEYEVAGAMRYVQLFRGNAAEAVTYSRQALALAEKIFGEERPETLTAVDRLAAALDDVGAYEEELSLYRRAVQGADALLGPTNAQATLPLKNVVEMLIDLGRSSEAAQALPSLLARAEEKESELASEILVVRGRVAVEQGEVVGGLALLDQGLQMAIRLGILDRPVASEVSQYAVEAYLLAGHPKEALALYGQGLAHLDIEPESPRWVTYLRLQGWADLDQGAEENERRAVAVLERALDLSSTHPFYPGWVPQLRYQLAVALLRTHGDAARAQRLLAQAHDGWVASGIDRCLRVGPQTRTSLGDAIQAALADLGPAKPTPSKAVKRARSKWLPKSDYQ